jgi:hypothetical protein
VNLGVEKVTGRVLSATQVALRAGIHFDKMDAEFEEECESGRIGTIGNRVKGNLPWVQIPPPPPRPITRQVPDQRHQPATGRVRLLRTKRRDVKHMHAVDPSV